VSAGGKWGVGAKWWVPEMGGRHRRPVMGFGTDWSPIVVTRTIKTTIFTTTNMTQIANVAGVELWAPPYGGRVVEVWMYLMVGRGSIPLLGSFITTLTYIPRSTR